MNKLYYYVDGADQKGPLAADQLKSVGITPDTLVWAEGFDNWKPAKEVDELSIVIMGTAPPPPPIAPAAPTVQTFYSHQKKKMACPACAEEIEEGLEFCPFCKEPLAKRQEAQIVTEKEKPPYYAQAPETKIAEKGKPNYALLKWMCYGAIAFAVISLLNDVGMLITFRGKYKLLTDIAENIPEWVVIIGSYILFVFLMLGLRKHYMMKSKRPIPFIALICFYTIANLLTLSIALDDYEVSRGFYMLAIRVTVWALIFQFIVGFQLKKRLKRASSVGIAMMVCPIVCVVIIIMSLFSPWLILLISGIDIIFYWVLKVFFDDMANCIDDDDNEVYQAEKKMTTFHRRRRPVQRRRIR